MCSTIPSRRKTFLQVHLNKNTIFLGKRSCSRNHEDCLLLSGGNVRCNHGRCIDGISSYSCECDVGWTGIFCNLDLDECSLGYCLNSSTCHNTQGSYTCTCEPGYTGRNCSINIDYCSESPCLHEGICRDKVYLVVYESIKVCWSNISSVPTQGLVGWMRLNLLSL